MAPVARAVPPPGAGTGPRRPGARGALAAAAAVLALAGPGLAGPPASDPGPGGDAALEQAVAGRVNAARGADGLAPLQLDPALTGVARAYSCRMARERFFSHVPPTGESVGDRVAEAGVAWAAVGENIAKVTGTRDPAASVVRGWMDSPGHRENILGSEFTRTGVGVCRQGREVHVTQVFLRPR